MTRAALPNPASNKGRRHVKKSYVPCGQSMASRRTPDATYRGRPEIRTESRTPAFIDSPIRFNLMMKGEVEATTLKEPYITLTEKKGWRIFARPSIRHGSSLRRGRHRDLQSIQPSGMRGSAPDQTDVRLRSDEPKADQHQHAGQGGEQEAIGNAGRQVTTD